MYCLSGYAFQTLKVNNKNYANVFFYDKMSWFSTLLLSICMYYSHACIGGGTVVFMTVYHKKFHTLLWRTWWYAIILPYIRVVAIRFPLGSEKYLVRALPLPRDLDKFSSGGKFISLVIYFLPKKGLSERCLRLRKKLYLCKIKMNKYLINNIV